MKVFIDTNVLLSAALFPGGVASRAYAAVLTGGHEMVVSDYVVAELRDVTARKFPTRVVAMTRFIEQLPAFAIVVHTPDREAAGENHIRDPKDRPVLRAAHASGCEILLTGDKDLLEAGLGRPEIVNPGTFLNRVH